MLVAAQPGDLLDQVDRRSAGPAASDGGRHRPASPAAVRRRPSQPIAVRVVDDLGRGPDAAGHPVRQVPRHPDGRAAAARSSTSVTGPAVPPPCSTSSADRELRPRRRPASVSTPRSNRRLASVGSLCRRAVRATVTGSKWAASSSTSRVAGPTSVLGAAHHAGQGEDPVAAAVGDQQVLRVQRRASTPSRVVSRSPARARRTTTGRVQGGQVEGVQRLADGEHHVVGHVDGQRDRPHPGLLEPAAQPARGRPRRRPRRGRPGRRTGRSRRRRGSGRRRPAGPRTPSSVGFGTSTCAGSVNAAPVRVRVLAGDAAHGSARTRGRG